MVRTRYRLVLILMLCLFVFIPKASSAGTEMVRFQINNANHPFDYAQGIHTLGFGVELARLIFTTSDYNVVYSADDWDSVMRRLDNHQIDICGLVPVTEDGVKSILYTDPVMEAHLAVYTDNFFPDISLEELPYLRVGVQNQDYVEHLLQNHLNFTNYRSFDSLEEPITMLASGQIDVLIGVQEAIDFAVIKYGQQGMIKAQITNLYPFELAYGVHQEKPHLVSFINNKLEELRSNGLFEEIYYRHFLHHSKYYYEDIKKTIFLISVIIALLVLAVNLYIKMLKGKLQKVTRSLQEQHDFLQATLNSVAEGVVVTDSKGIITFCNRLALNFTGYKSEDMVGKHFADVLKFNQELTGHRIYIPYEDIMKRKHVLRREDDVVLECADGCFLFAGFSVAPIITNKVLTDGVVIVFWDLTSQRDVRLALAESEAKFRGIFEAANDAIFVVDLNGIIVDANPAAAKMYLYSRTELIGKHLLELSREEDYRLIEKILEKMDNCEAIAFAMDSRRKDGTFVSTEGSMRLCTMGKEKRVVMLARDVTERKKYEEAIKHRALHDALTDLPNRTLFDERVESALARAKRNNYKSAVMFLDLDSFKLINDNYGHSIGDLLLIGVGKRLTAILRQEDTVARLGGDEFAVLLPQINSAADAGRVAEKISQEILKPWSINGHDFTITFSIGIALYPDDGQSGEELIRNADLAMYRAKLSGKNNYKYYGLEKIS